MSRSQVFIAFAAAGLAFAVVRAWLGFAPENVDLDAALYWNRLLGAGGALVLHWLTTR